jgi:putative oxidoreductase
LVFLRAATTIPIVQFIVASPATTLPVTVIFQFLAAICSALLIIGLWTPVAGLFMAVSELSLLFFPSTIGSMHIVLAALGVALAMIGPGAWSVDARLFGRKRIRIPQR